MQDIQADQATNALARKVLAHWQQEFGSTVVTDEPFQHLYSQNIWPQDVYVELLRLLPPRDLYQPLNIKQWVSKSGESTRDSCYLSETIDRMDPERAGFWTQIALAITSDSFKRLVFNKFKRDVALRLNVAPNRVDEANMFIGISLIRDMEDYCLKPHPDGQPRVVTAQFYLPTDTSQKDLGTSIYEAVPLTQQLFSGRFREVKRMPFLPNSGYAFAVNDQPKRRSLHGRELIESGSGIRNSILITWVSEKSDQRKANRGAFWETHRQFE